MAEQESFEALEAENTKTNEEVGEEEEPEEDDEDESEGGDEDDDDEEEAEGGDGRGEFQSSDQLVEVEIKQSGVETLAVPSSRVLSENDQPAGRSFRK